MAISPETRTTFPRRPGFVVPHLLRSVTWPHWSAHAWRAALTVVGVSLGVSTVTAVTSINASLLASFRHVVETVAGSSQLEITGHAGDIDERLISVAAGTPGVAAAAGVVESFLPLAARPEDNVYLLGVDFLGSPVWESQFPRRSIEIEDDLEFLAHLDSVVVTPSLAARMGVAPGQDLRVVAPAGEATLRIRGLLHDAAPAQLFDGMIAVMDLPAAQRLLGKTGLDRIAVELLPDARPDEVRERLAAAIGPGADVAATEARGRQSEQLLFALRSMLLSGAALAVIVAVFIVFHSVASSVQQRRREFALLNAVGVERRTLLRLCLIETHWLAALGVGLGLVGGRLLAKLAAHSVGAAASEVWTRVDVSQQPHPASAILAGIAVGLGTAQVAAYLAMRATFRGPTIESLRPTGVELDAQPPLARRIALALVLTAVTWPVVLAAPARPGFVALVTLIIVTHAAVYLAGAIIAAPAVVCLGRGLARVGHRLRWVPARLAIDSLPRRWGAGGAVVATVGAGVGMIIQFTGLVQSFDTAWTTWINTHFAADLFVGSGARFRLLAGPPMGEEIRERLAGVPGVAQVEPFRVRMMQLGDQTVYLNGISVSHRLAHDGLAMVEGSLAEAAAAMRAGTAVLLSDNLAFRLGLHRGNDLLVPTPAGPRRYRIAGTFVDYLASLDLGAVAVDSAELAAVWNDRSANLFRVWLSPGVSPSAARAEVMARLGPGFFVITSRQFLDAVHAVLDTLFLATWALVFVAAGVGVIGVLNAQLASVMDRGPEIAMLRTVGLSARHIAGAVLLECAMLGALGGLLGIAMGGMLGRQMVTVDLTLITGWRIPYRLGDAPLLAGVGCAMLVSGLAGWVPATAAARFRAIRSVD